METITYNLINNSENSNSFYEKLSKFTDFVVTKGLEKFEGVINKYYNFRKNNEFRILSKEEYLVEIMSIGVFWNLYGQYAANNSEKDILKMKYLYDLRKKIPKLKSKIDEQRGRLNQYLLLKKGELLLDKNTDGLSLLQKWLEATGDFNIESEKINDWIMFLNTLNINYSHEFILSASDFANSFEFYALEHLSEYTHAVNEFLINEEKKYENREDRIFCGKHEVEYHLNMVGAEILNRALRENFLKNKTKIVLLPTCMNNNPDCHGKLKNGNLTCSNCNDECNIAKVNRFLKSKNIELVLIPHTSGFSKILKKWENAKDTGLIAVTCVLNLVTGGYEMDKLNLSSQCVFLDYCGCKKHWHETGIATNINLDKLKSIL